MLSDTFKISLSTFVLAVVPREECASDLCFQYATELVSALIISKLQCAKLSLYKQVVWITLALWMWNMSSSKQLPHHFPHHMPGCSMQNFRNFSCCVLYLFIPYQWPQSLCILPLAKLLSPVLPSLQSSSASGPFRLWQQPPPRSHCFYSHGSCGFPGQDSPAHFMAAKPELTGLNITSGTLCGLAPPHFSRPILYSCSLHLKQFGCFFAKCFCISACSLCLGCSFCHSSPSQLLLNLQILAQMLL